MRFCLCFTAKILQTVPRFEKKDMDLVEEGENFPGSISLNDGMQAPGMTHSVFLSSV